MERQGTEAGDGEATGMAGKVRQALVRPATYLGHARELAGAGICVALYPFGFSSQSPAPLPAQPDPARERGPAPAPARTPVVLVHGYAHNRSGWTFLTRDLRRAGFDDITACNYNPLARDIPLLAESVADLVEEVRDRTGSPRVHLVGHSLGGLLARYYVQLLGGDEAVDTAVTIATPHHGTHAARIAPGRTAAQLRPDSWVIRRLAESATPSAVRWIAYYSNLDLLVQPAASARLDHPALNATNICVKDLGHLSLLVSGRLTRSVAGQLAAADGVAGFGSPLRGLPDRSPATASDPAAGDEAGTGRAARSVAP